METTVMTQQKATVRQVLDDVYEEVNWAYLAKTISESRVHGFTISSAAETAAPLTILATLTATALKVR